VRTVLVCVRTPLAAQTVTSAAARLGMTGVVRTAVSETEALLRLTERPADIVLVDTALTRRDSVGFTRRVLVRSPGAVIILFGAEDPRVAAAVIAAGARGVLRGGDHDLVSVVAKALLLCLPERPPARAAVQGEAASRAALPAETSGEPANGSGLAGGSVAGGGPGTPGRPVAGAPPRPTNGPTMVPVQRADQGEVGPGGAGRPPGGPNSGSWRVGPRTGDRPPEAVARRMALTERELQVLRGMADGKSNAEIGRELFVSEDTVKTHARRLFRKLGARDRAHAVAAGFRAGLVA
jgi:DNA-binding NarL/FixJ family response regulator